MNKIIGIILTFVALLVLVPFSTKADGGIFYPPEFPVYEKGQKALIYLHDGTEDLVIQPSYQGSAKDFVWVVPTPTKPEVNKSSISVFTALQKLTTPDTSFRRYDSGIQTMSLKSSSQEVQVIEEKTIDSFDIVTLKASSETALSEWMKENNYSFPVDKNYLLSDYINEGWYFVIAKIRPEAEVGAQSDLNDGTITPIRFTFQSEKMIYPMKLTRVAMEQAPVPILSQSESASMPESVSKKRNYYQDYGSRIILYALSNNRVGNSQLDTSWANWLNPQDIKTILSESTEKNWIPSEKKLFLTKMDHSIYSDQIDGDLVLAAYKNNNIYPTPFYKEGQYWLSLIASFGVAAIILILSPVLLLFVILSLKEKYDEKWLKKSKWLKLVLVVLFLSLGIFLLVVSWLEFGSFTHLIEEGGFIGAAIAFVIMEIILILATVKDFLRQKKLAGEKVVTKPLTKY